MSSDIKLLPCPCCGSGTKIGIIASKHFIFYQAVCLECGLTAKATPTPELTAEKWNTRKPMDRIVEQLEKEQEGLETDIWARECDNWYGHYCNGVEEGIDKAIEMIKAGGNNET